MRLAILIFAAALYCLHGASLQQSNGFETNGKKTPDTNGQKNAPKTVINVEHCDEFRSPVPGETTQHESTYLRWGFFIQVGLLVCTFGIAVYSAIQASASKRNALALINAQRAWVMATPMDLRPPLGFIPEAGDALNSPGRDTVNVFGVRFMNVGITPARILETCALYTAVERLEALPSEPKYSGIDQQDGLLLFNRKDSEGRDEAIGRIAYLMPNLILTKNEVTEVRERKRFLYAYGFVFYEDAFNRKHTMRFGYVYNFPKAGDPPMQGFLPAGPPKYNQSD